ncbi:MAG TPA: glycosyltransferase family 39 protein [Caulobacteraceae bacterium]|nr:glycosyltransferase family 39 protein [Caulobacteraceae bacterium]
MNLRKLLDQVSARGRGPLLAALVALAAGLPAIFTLPATDRDESRFAEASAQMLETGDFTNIMFQAEPRSKKPVGIYWLQAASVKTLSSVERRQIWAYRIPSLLGAMLAAAACAWGAAAFLPGWAATMAGALLGTTAVLSTEAALATTDAALCGAVTLAMAALGRLYLAANGGTAAGWRTRTLFWVGLSASVLLKGPIGPMVVLATMLVLAAWDRRIDWLGRLGWSWGPIILAAMVLPWALAITVATDGAFWGAAIGGDLAPKLMGGQEGHGAPPGYFAALSPVTLFPAVLLLPAGLAAGWRRRGEPAIRFALCWLIPSWLIFELVPSKLPHYTLPTYGALAWLMAAALADPIGRAMRWTGAGLALLGAFAFAGLGLYAGATYGGAASWIWAAVAALVYLAAAAAGARLLLRGRSAAAAAVACGLGLAAHGVLAGALAPSLKPLWLSSRLARTLARAGISPRQGLAESPVTIAGYAEPSAVFALGAHTQLGGAADAAQAIADGRPAVVEGRDQAAFEKALAGDGASARLVGQVAGLDYSTGKPQSLRVYEPAADATDTAGAVLPPAAAGEARPPPG